jgi:hypothetical protein
LAAKRSENKKTGEDVMRGTGCTFPLLVSQIKGPSGKWGKDLRNDK